MSKLKIYRASAGSGKTYTLTREFLFLLFDNPLNYKHTLAVTFTNKATGEMKSRILEKLYQISVGTTRDYVDDLCKEFNLSEKKVQKRAHVLLSYLLHDFSSFSVSTIDSFFQKIIRSFAREAGLESGFKIELNASRILQKAIDHLLMKVDLPENKHLKNWLVQFAEQKLRQGKSWNLSNDLNSLGSEIFNELFQIESRDLLIHISNKEWMNNYLKQMQDIIQNFESQISKIGEEGSTVISKIGLQYDDFTGKSRSPLKYFEKLKTLDKIEVNTAVSKLIDLPEKWGRKDNNPKTNETIEEIFPLLNKLLKQALNIIENDFETYNTAKVITLNYYALGIIADIALEVQNICREENIFLIADSSHFLNKIIDQNDTPFIYEKIGTRYQNFMIDEFQDTSKLQWQNFRPLVDNSLSSNDTSLIVGDVKQSIYRWRNSDWNLLDQQVINDFHQHGNDLKTLDQNYRSEANIIKFNNSIFSATSKFVQNDFNHTISEYINKSETSENFKSKISHAYLDVFQNIPGHNKEENGHIHVRFLPNEKGITYNEQMLPEMVQKIENILQHGYKYSDICILVRKKGEGETIANALLSGNYSDSGTTIPVVSNESLFLSGSSAINFIMAQIKYLQNSSNGILKADLVLNKQLLEKQDNDETNIEIGHIFDFDSESSFKDHTYAWIDELLSKKQKPLLELVEYLANKLPDQVKKEQGIFIQAFINCTNQFIKDHYPDLTAFIEWWEDKGKTEAIAVPDDQDAIKIMTVHKSKGLEFKVVLIPFCNWKLDTEINSNTIWCQPDQEPFNSIKLLPVTYTSRLRNTIFKEAYFQELMYQYVDSLNLLYVAFTRCCEALVTFGSTPSKSSSSGFKSVSDLLFFTFNNSELTDEKSDFLDLNSGWNEETGLFTYGNLKQQKKQPESSSDIISEQLKPFTNNLLSNKNIAIKSESDDYFSKDTKYSRINHGKIMHEAFENIIDINDVDNALTQMIFEGKLSENDKENISQQIKSLISQNTTKEWFNANHIIKTENNILTPTGTYRPDRVVFFNNEVHVIDYKFGEHIEKKYENQILQYLKQIKSMGNNNVKGFIWYITLEKIVEIKPDAIQGNLF